MDGVALVDWRLVDLIYGLPIGGILGSSCELCYCFC